MPNIRVVPYDGTLYLFHGRLLCFVIQTPCFHVLGHDVHFIEDMQSQATLLFPKVRMDYCSFLWKKLEKDLVLNEIRGIIRTK